MFAALLAKLNNAANRGIARVFAMKGTIIVLNFAVISLAARLLGEAPFGTYSILFSAIGLLSTVAMLGQQVLLMRSWSQYVAAGDPARLKGALIFGAATLALGTIVVGAGFFAWVAITYSPWLAVAATTYLVALTLVFTSAHLIRSAVSVGDGDGYANILMTGAPVLYLALAALTGHPADLATILLLFAAGALVAFALHMLMLRRALHAQFPGFAATPARYELAEWRARSAKLWLSHSLEAANQYLDVLVIGALLSPTIAGAYFVITRLANAFATAADAMNMFSTRHIPELYFRREFGALGRLLNSVAMITLLITLAGMTAFVLLGSPILAIFNTGYTAYYPALIILCVGTAALGTVGPSASILVLTGHEGRYLQIMAVAVALRVAGFVVLVPGLGVLGAAVATAVSFLLMAVLLAHAAKRRTGIDGSVARLFHRRNDPAIAPAE